MVVLPLIVVAASLAVALTLCSKPDKMGQGGSQLDRPRKSKKSKEKKKSAKKKEKETKEKDKPVKAPQPQRPISTSSSKQSTEEEKPPEQKLKFDFPVKSELELEDTDLDSDIADPKNPLCDKKVQEKLMNTQRSTMAKSVMPTTSTTSLAGKAPEGRQSNSPLPPETKRQKEKTDNNTKTARLPTSKAPSQAARIQSESKLPPVEVKPAEAPKTKSKEEIKAPEVKEKETKEPKEDDLVTPPIHSPPKEHKEPAPPSAYLDVQVAKPEKAAPSFVPTVMSRDTPPDESSQSSEAKSDSGKSEKSVPAKSKDTSSYL